jgi:hypothetical protein
MLRFFQVLCLFCALTASLYFATCIIVTGFSYPEVIAYTSSTSLNHSLHRSYQQAEGYIVGSSIALRNLDANILTRELNKEFQVIAGHGLYPLETLKVINRTGLNNVMVIIPLHVAHFAKLNGPENLKWNPYRIKNLRDFRNDRYINKIPSYQIGTIQFNNRGNAFFLSCEQGMLMPIERHGNVSQNEGVILTRGSCELFLKKLVDLQDVRNLDIHLVLMPYSTNYMDISDEQKKIYEESVKCFVNNRLSVHNFCYDEPDFEKFIDFGHMSNIGARDFTFDFAKHLATQIPIKETQ